MGQRRDFYEDGDGQKTRENRGKMKEKCRRYWVAVLPISPATQFHLRHSHSIFPKCTAPTDSRGIVTWNTGFYYTSVLQDFSCGLKDIASHAHPIEMSTRSRILAARPTQLIAVQPYAFQKKSAAGNSARVLNVSQVSTVMFRLLNLYKPSGSHTHTFSSSQPRCQ